MKGDEENSPSNVIPLRTILQNFLNLVENYEAGRVDGVDLYDREFHELKQYSESLKSDPDYQSKEGEKSVNRKKNRYKDILPFDYTRVALADHGDIPGSDYINANFIKGASGSSAYIACQGPLSHTASDFWRMVVECEVQVVVMACMEQESGKHKCENYWVEEDGVEKQFGQVTVWLKKCRNVCPDFLVRTMRIRFPNSRGEMEERNVCQFHYSAWPDHGVPSKVRPLLDMVRLIRDCQTSETLPVLIHCSAGCGRTGTICAIDYVWGLLRLGKLTPDFSLFQLVRDMRRQRIAMVQTKDQYILVHRAVKELFQDQLKIIEAHPYANVDENGLPFNIKQDLEEPTYETIEFDGSGAHTLPDFLVRDDFISEKIKISSVKSKNGGSTSRSKLKKEVENRKEKHKEYHQERVRGSRPPEPMPPGVNEVQTENIEKYDCTDRGAEPIKALPSSNGSPVRSSLLRKPSMVKLKAFFEKSTKDESKEKKLGSGPGSQLSRAKSDVSSSSRFYSFASAFGGSRGHLSVQSNGSNNNNEPVLLKSSARSESPAKEKTINGKPPLSAKPILPVKRSKSLKIHPAESTSKIATYKMSNGSRADNLRADGSHSKQNSTSSPDFSTVSPNNPIKVCIKQVDMPKLQTIVSSSVKAEARTALLNSYDEHSNGELKSKNATESPPRKSSSPLMTSMDGHNYVNITYGNNRIKMGIAKEMEDLSDFEIPKRNSKLGKIKKYDTVNPRSLGGSVFCETEEITGTGLTRSQSHVWQPERVHLSQSDRIFSDENIHHKSIRGSSNKNESQRKVTAESSTSRIPAEVSLSQRQFQHSSLLQTPATDKSVGLHMNSVNLNSVKPPFFEEPVVRRRVPKTNPYTNFPCTGTERHSPAFLRVAQSHGEETRLNPSERLNGITDYLPQFTGCYNGNVITNGNNSVGNSSDSSSNVGTPRNSLPSTPTESIDVLYPQVLRSTNCNGNGNGPTGGVASPKLQRLCYNGGNPKSILKGSLSSTPSESDERLNSNSTTRGLGHTLSSILTSTASQSPLSAMRVGNRERRNSFRQAVWKEAVQNDCQQYQGQPVYSSSTSASQNLNPPVKSHKDYEPIWPDGNACTTSKTFLNVSTLIDRGSPPVISANSRHNGASQYLPSHPIEDEFAGSELSNGVTNSNTPFQSRMDEIKLLLKELKTPIGIAESNGNRQPTNNNLKYQRSLKAPTRAQYQENGQGGSSLSCFTLKKPSSLESIPDQLYVQNQTLEEYQPLLAAPKAIKSYAQHVQQNENLQRCGGFHSGGHANDYVTLQHCRTSDSSQGGFEVESNEEGTVVKRTPIPPPRTKPKKGQHAISSIESRDSVDKSSSANDLSSAGRAAALSVWTGKTNNQNRLMENEISIESRVEESGQQQRSNGAVTSTSPKALVRAIGLFQAKAANVRSRFANWTETKERNNHQGRKDPLRSTSGETSYILRDQGDLQDDDSGFVSSTRLNTNSSQIGASRATKHQYL